MSGISRIAQKRDAIRNPVERSTNQEVWFKDGDQAFLSPVATGNEDDTKLDEIYMYTFRNADNRWTNRLQDDSVANSDIPSNIRPAHKFAFWAYVHEIIHPEKKNDSWEELAGPAGRKVFKESVNDFRVIALTFGRSDYIWNQLVDVYNDWNGLDKGVIRVKRTGTGMYDTSYTIAATARASEIPEDKLAAVTDLPSIKGYFLERYGNPISPNGTVSLDEESSNDNNSDLF